MLSELNEYTVTEYLPFQEIRISRAAETT